MARARNEAGTRNQKEESQQNMAMEGQGQGPAEKEAQTSLTQLSLTRVTSTMAWPRDWYSAATEEGTDGRGS